MIAQKNRSNAALNAKMEVGVTAFHFSIKVDERRALNYNHEYQIMFIEPSDGTHVFGVQLGSIMFYRHEFPLHLNWHVGHG